MGISNSMVLLTVQADEHKPELHDETQLEEQPEAQFVLTQLIAVLPLQPLTHLLSHPEKQALSQPKRHTPKKPPIKSINPFPPKT